MELELDRDLNRGLPIRTNSSDSSYETELCSSMTHVPPGEVPGRLFRAAAMEVEGNYLRRSWMQTNHRKVLVLHSMNGGGGGCSNSGSGAPSGPSTCLVQMSSQSACHLLTFMLSI